MPDSVGAILEQEITAHLQKRGYTVIPSSVLAGIRQQMEAQVGGIQDPETGQVDYAKKQAVREHAFRELWFRETFDAMATIRVSMTQVPMESDQVEWDGAKQKIEHEGRSKKYSANATVSSVSFAVYDSRDNPLYLNFGGLESLVQRANGQIVALEVEKLFHDEERIREAAEIAVDPI